LLTPALLGEVVLPSVFGSHMVLQRGKPLTVWGTADAGEKVSVEIAGRRVKALADARGEWSVTLPEMVAGGPHTLTVAGENRIELEDVFVGEVWIGSGQSNMQWSVAASKDAAKERAAANHPRVRLFLVPNVLSGLPNRDVKARWTECGPGTISPFSAVLYFFGRHLHRELDVPVGLIASAWGGSRIEPWTPPPGFAGVEELESIRDDVRTRQLEYLDAVGTRIRALPTPRADLAAWLPLAKAAAARDQVLPAAPAFGWPPHPLAGWPTATSMFNAMIHPLVPFAVRGAIWYQGESNLGEGMLYAHKTRALVEGWRKVWGDDALSFYWAQLAPFNYGGDGRRLPQIWEAQQAATSIPRTGMAVITDIGNLGDIHPRNKQEVGRRLALIALAKDYGRDIVHSGPIYRSMRIEGRRVRVSFDHTGSGLSSRDGEPLSRFEIAGGGEFVPGQAVIDGDTVVVWSDRVAAPTAVRFAWDQLSEPNLQNHEGLQACPFRTYSTPPSISGKRLFVSGSRVEIACVESDGEIRYTIDGTEPTASSPRYGGPIPVTGTATVRARFFRRGGILSTVTQATFTKVEPRRHAGKTLVPGLRYEYYEGQWGKLPDFDGIEAVKRGSVDEITLSPRRRDDHFGLRFTGYVEIEKAGRYTFQCESDDGSRIRVDGKAIVNVDGVHPVVSKQQTIDLETGLHEVVVDYFELAGGEWLRARYSREGGTLEAIPFWCEE